MKRIFSLHSLNLIVFSIGLSTSAIAAQPTIKAGWYDAMKVAVTPDNKVEGYYFEALGEGVSRECSFYLQGEIVESAKIPITTWSSETYPGTVAASSRGLELTVEHGDWHDGCVSVMAPMIETGMELSRIASKPWIGLVTIAIDKSYLQKQKGGTATKGPYIIKRDVVGVLEYDGDWAKVEFVNGDGRSFVGWIAPSQFTKLSPPVVSKTEQKAVTDIDT